jgi:UPF0716 protein FxsA
MVVLVLIGVPVIEVFVFIEVGRAIGWLPTVVLLLGTSVLGAQLLRIRGRLAIERLSLAVSEHRAPAPAQTAIDGALGFLGCVLLIVPGFVTDLLGALLVLPPIRRRAGRRISQHYAGRLMRFLATTERFTWRERNAHPANVDSTAIDDDVDQLDR